MYIGLAHLRWDQVVHADLVTRKAVLSAAVWVLGANRNSALVVGVARACRSRASLSLTLLLVTEIVSRLADGVEHPWEGRNLCCEQRCKGSFGKHCFN